VKESDRECKGVVKGRQEWLSQLSVIKISKSERQRSQDCTSEGSRLRREATTKLRRRKRGMTSENGRVCRMNRREQAGNAESDERGEKRKDGNLCQNKDRIGTKVKVLREGDNGGGGTGKKK